MSEFEHNKLTPWGYIADTEVLPNFITVAEFDLFTGSKFGADSRISVNIPSASEAIRDFCGWHIYPNLTCGMIYNVLNLRDAFVGSDLLIQLPSTYVTGIEKVLLNARMNPSTGYYEGDEVTEYDAGMGNGHLKLYDVGGLDRKSKIFVKFRSGYETAPSRIKGLTADRVTHAVVNPYGINSEAAGGVSVSYSGVYMASGNASALPSDSREILEAYRCKGVY